MSFLQGALYWIVNLTYYMCRQFCLTFYESMFMFKIIALIMATSSDPVIQHKSNTTYSHSSLFLYAA